MTLKKNVIGFEKIISKVIQNQKVVLKYLLLKILFKNYIWNLKKREIIYLISKIAFNILQTYYIAWLKQIWLQQISKGNAFNNSENAFILCEQ